MSKFRFFPVFFVVALQFCLQFSAHAQTPPTLLEVMDEQPVDVGAPLVKFGSGECQLQRSQILLGKRYITLVVSFLPNAYCYVQALVRGSTLETPEKTLPAVGGYGAGRQSKNYLVFESNNTSVDMAKQALFNSAGQREPLPPGKSYAYGQHAFLWGVFRAQDQFRAQEGSRRVQRLESEGGLPAYMAKLGGQFPDFSMVQGLFMKATPLPDNACSKGVFKTLAKLVGNIKTPALQFDADLSHAAYNVSAYRTAAGLAQLNQTPNLDYVDYVPMAGQTAPQARGLAVLPSEDCKQAFLKADTEGPMAGGFKYGETAYAEIRADFSGDFIQGRLLNRFYSGNSIMDRKPFAGALPAIDFLCTFDKCYAGSVESVFEQNVLKSTDAWPAELKTSIAALEQQRDRKLAQNKREREAREVQEAAQQRQAQAETTKRQQADERALNSALGAKDPQSMYMAAGKYEREGESYKASQVYEKLIARFGGSLWAVKANDQLLQNRRVNAVNSSNQRVSNEAGERAVTACRIEMNACYDRKGQDCYRSCETLR